MELSASVTRAQKIDCPDAPFDTPDGETDGESNEGQTVVVDGETVDGGTGDGETAGGGTDEI